MGPAEQSGVRGALASLRVLELATLHAGPLVGAMLGDYGADVVKVEVLRGDDFRRLGGGTSGRPSRWAATGRNKRTVCLDHTTADGLDVLHRLTAVADVVITNQPRNLLDAMGCTYEQLALGNPNVVMLHISGWGDTGPYADRPGNGTVAEAFAGLTHASTPRGSEPVLGDALLGDNLAALQGTIGVLAACLHRAAGGPGQYIELSMVDAVIAVLTPQIIEHQAGTIDTDEPADAPGVREALPTADGHWVVVTAYSDAQVSRLLRALDADTDTGTPLATRDLPQLSRAWTSTRSLAEVLESLGAHGIAGAAVNDVDSLLLDPHVRARRSIVEIDEPGFGLARLPQPAPRLSATPARVRWLARDLAADNAGVCRSWLEMTDDEIRQLRASGAMP